MSNFNFDTYCGLYCGACSIIKAYQTGIKDPLACCLGDELGMELKCHGCKTDTVFGNCAVCMIRNCVREKGMERCLDCPDYPCPNFDSMQFLLEKVPHWNTAAVNQEYIQNYGADRWLQQQAAQWKCPDCQTDYTWYATHCSGCGKELGELKSYRNSFDPSIFQMIAMPSPEEVFKQESLFKLAGTDLVKSQNDMVYSMREDGELLFDLYFPPDHQPGQKHPVVVLVHGESPLTNLKDSGPFISAGRIIGASGLAAATFNHRSMLQGLEIKDVVEDIENLLTFLVDHADQYGLDKNRIAIWSYSAGSPFGLYAGIHNTPAYIKCMVAYYGFCDFAALSKLLNLPVKPETAEQYSPVNLLNQNPDKIAPMLIARAGADPLPGILDSQDHFISTAFANNLQIDVYNHPAGVHAFDLYNDEPRTHEIIEKTLEFLEKHLR
ncbi:MAG: DUF3795 domain-containing protein [Syntrophomonadaceae bacterium]|nr:DUF3795 domain-containing protein [Syntrophomonadaceae bacterium]MDD3022919.1 DUF3795 domain-containing protein [Syntrophomonadaceae bacterium]